MKHSTDEYKMFQNLPFMSDCFILSIKLATF